jgi:hypothetical protein
MEELKCTFSSLNSYNLLQGSGGDESWNDLSESWATSDKKPVTNETLAKR